MSFKFKYNLWRAGRKMNPGQKFKAVLWQDLAAAWREKYQTDYFWYQRAAFKWAAAGVLGLVLTSSLGTGVYAYNNPEVTEGTILYPLKQKIEQVEELTKRTPEAKAKFYLKEIARREAEKVVLERKQKKMGQAANKIKAVENRIKAVESKLEKADKFLEKMEVKDRDLKPRVKQRLEQRAERVKELQIKAAERRESLQDKKGRLEEVRKRINQKNEDSVLVPNLRNRGRNGIRSSIDD